MISSSVTFLIMTDLHRFNNMTQEETEEVFVWTVFRNNIPYHLFEGDVAEAEFELAEWHHQAWLDCGGYTDNGMDNYTMSQ